MRDCHAILEVKDDLRGTGSLNWSDSTNITTWEGVTVTDGRIAKVELPNESLTGSIPAGLANLTALTHLDLSGNSLTGEIPEGLGTFG